ncbi:hypothetical protein GCM10022247_05910 [Allokutzneria multivorans]|uniref:Uncharacterized protein n=1 Tax=Allokutzneria multivorans TaxID=1142134 RepID=A0ABP7QZ61_9PSEU
MSETALVRILGYVDGFQPTVAEDTLVHRMDLLGGPLFWPLFLSTVGGASCAIEAFDVDPADLSALGEELFDESQWPVFTLAVRDGHRVHVVLCNFPGEECTDYLVGPADGGAAVRFAELSGHFRGPGLSWPELVTTSQQPDADLSAGARMLLLLPALGDTATPPAARELIAAAVTSVGATCAQRAVAEELLDSSRFWSPADWHTTDGVSWCGGPHTYRTRNNPVLGLFSTAFGSASGSP